MAVGAILVGTTVAGSEITCTGSGDGVNVVKGGVVDGGPVNWTASLDWHAAVRERTNESNKTRMNLTIESGNTRRAVQR